jgi:hypothetical protein
MPDARCRMPDAERGTGSAAAFSGHWDLSILH